MAEHHPCQWGVHKHKDREVLEAHRLIKHKDREVLEAHSLNKHKDQEVLEAHRLIYHLLFLVDHHLIKQLHPEVHLKEGVLLQLKWEWHLKAGRLLSRPVICLDHHKSLNTPPLYNLCSLSKFTLNNSNNSKSKNIFLTLPQLLIAYVQKALLRDQI